MHFKIRLAVATMTEEHMEVEDAVASSTIAAADDLSQWKDVTRKTNVLLSKKLTIESYWTQNTRPDGRLLSQCRPLTLTRNIIRKTTYGSALLTLQSSKRAVVAGVSLQIGRIVVPGGGGDVRVTVSQPQQQQQQQQSSASASSAAVDVSLLQSWLERTLEETLDLQQLILSNGNQAWSLQVQLQIINSRVGNLRDFCFLAALAAIHDTVFPETVVEMNNSNKQTTTYLKQQGDDLAEPAAKQRRFKLPIVPIPLTLGLWVTGAEPRWVVDLTRDEEEQCRGQLTLIVNAVSNKVLQCDWVSTQGIDPTMIAVGVHMAQARAKELKPEFGLE